MSGWQNKPPSDDRVPALRVVRTPGHRPFRAHILSTDLIGCMTHYTNGRTYKCQGEGCQICALPQKPRWYGYFAIYNEKSGSRALFEIPRGAFIAFDDYMVKHGTLRGAFMTAYRKPDRPNGQVVCRLDPPPRPPENWPDEPDVFRTLCQMWGLSWQVEHAERLRLARLNAEALKTQPEPPPQVLPIPDRIRNAPSPGNGKPPQQPT